MIINLTKQYVVTFWSYDRIHKEEFYDLSCKFSMNHLTCFIVRDYFIVLRNFDSLKIRCLTRINKVGFTCLELKVRPLIEMKVTT